MSADEAFIWDRPTPELRPRRDPHDEDADDSDGRISLRDAENRFGVRVSTLRAWARRGAINGVRRGGGQWMVTPESVAHHLSRHSPQVGQHDRTPDAGSDTSMLVPRDAWDKLMDQLGNLHEAGLQLAEARERAAKAETEATFLRERLAEMRDERDALRAKRGQLDGDSDDKPKRPRWWRRPG